MGSWFFKGLNFTNNQHPQNLWNICTSKNLTYFLITTVDLLPKPLGMWCPFFPRSKLILPVRTFLFNTRVVPVVMQASFRNASNVLYIESLECCECHFYALKIIITTDTVEFTPTTSLATCIETKNNMAYSFWGTVLPGSLLYKYISM